jgi:hypothetical protein
MRPGNGRAGWSPAGSADRAFLAAACLFAASGLGGCATGDPITAGTTSGGGSSGDGGASGNGGNSGAGAAGQGGSGAGQATTSNGPGVTTTTGPGGPTTTTTTSSPASSSSTGTPCDEDPCKLVAPQCGCGADEMCTLAGGGTRVCTDEGSRAPG